LAALDAIAQATGESEVNAIGYCIGGTLLASTLAYMASKKDNRIKSATFFVTMMDFEEAGELGVFIDEEQLRALEDKMNKRGYLEGSEMANTFNMLRANDLIWSFVINNYLLGRDPFPFDLLHWNQDSTRMPAKMHSFYLRNMYMKNKLREPGAITLAGVPIALTKVRSPSYFISAMEDHIAPWKATYAGAHALGGQARFVLSGSGHIAGMINPPAANKYGYWTNDKLPADAEEWLAGAKQHPGSWWDDWFAWLKPYAGPEVPARELTKGNGKNRRRLIEPAPGSYARIRADMR
jgi:polyhydroxyalkanoate synthase